MSYQVLARKWRPANFHQLVGQQHVKKALITALDAERLHHAYLFTGTRGVGKTTIARILSKCLNCDNGISSTPCGSCSACTAIAEGRFVDLIEVDAASRTKVDDTRELLDNVQYRPTEGRYKVYLIDEVHMLSTHSFNALLKTLEEPPPHVIFLLATTDPQKLPVTVLSRCLQFHLRHMSEDEISNHLGFILGEEKINFDAASLDLLAAASDGSMRDGLSLLDQAIAHGGGSVSESDVKEMLGTVERAPIWQLFEDIMARDDTAVFAGIDSLSEFSNDFSPVLDEMLHALHQLAVAQKLPTEKQKLSPKAIMLSEKITAEDLQLYYQITLHGQRDLPLASSSRMGFEMTVLRLMAFQPAKEVALSSLPSSSEQNANSSAQKKTEDKPNLTQNPPQQAIIDNNPSVSVDSIATVGTNPEQINSVQRKDNVASFPEQTIIENTVSEPRIEAKTLEVSDSNWPQITATLELHGMSRQMMINSRFVSILDGQIKVSCKNLLPQALTEDRQKQINQAVSAAIGAEVSVLIEAMEKVVGRGESAMEVDCRETSERQTLAEEKIANDSLVKDVLAKFDGTIREDSVKPL